MHPRPMSVKPLEGYRLLVTFRDSQQKIFDMTPLLELPCYQKLKNKGFFLLAKVDNMTVYWDDDIDVCPDALYENGVSIN